MLFSNIFFFSQHVFYTIKQKQFEPHINDSDNPNNFLLVGEELTLYHPANF